MTSPAIESFPLSFICSSGELLWGQLHSIYRGWQNKNYDGPDPIDFQCNRTILQSHFNYRIKALSGRWTINALPGPLEKDFYIFAHESQDFQILYQRLLDKEFDQPIDEDKHVQFVNRYDWAAAKESSEIENLEKILLPDFLSRVISQRCILLDALQSVEIFIEALSKEEELQSCLSFFKGKEICGIHVANRHTEYEYAYLFFNDQRELIGFLYYAADTGRRINFEREEAKA